LGKSSLPLLLRAEVDRQQAGDIRPGGDGVAADDALKGDRLLTDLLGERPDLLPRAELQFGLYVGEFSSKHYPP
jgi:hypothetical protein